MSPITKKLNMKEFFVEKNKLVLNYSKMSNSARNVEKIVRRFSAVAAVPHCPYS